MSSKISNTYTPYQVVICTYNGERYIAEQLRSVLRQTPPPIEVIVSDDGSTDSTLEVAESLARETPIPITIIKGPGKGVVYNFCHALKHTQAPYVFLADQDDIWLDNKAELFCAHMNANSKPHLIFSDAWVWEPKENKRTSFWKADKLTPEYAEDPKRLAFQNTIQGASMCVNQALIKLLEANSNIVMHDWWAGLIASSIGEVSIIRQPTMLYRQHSANLIGSQSHKKSKLDPDWIRKRKKAAQRILVQASTFSEHFSEKMEPELKNFFRDLHKAINTNFLNRMYFIVKWRPKHRSALHTLAFWISIAKLKIK